MATEISLWLLAAYLVGGIPFGFIIGKLRGVDVRTVGSKNIGATNVFRTVGKKWGILALVLDILKGLVPTLVCKLTAGTQWLPLCVGVMTAVGHMLTPYMKFRGGKGVATGFGMMIALIPAHCALRSRCSRRCSPPPTTFRSGRARRRRFWASACGCRSVPSRATAICRRRF